jgi:hypothetical protein
MSAGQYYGVPRQYHSANAPYSLFYRRLNMIVAMDTLKEQNGDWQPECVLEITVF